LVTGATRTRLHEPHHDGSERYLVERATEPGDEVAVRLRTARAFEPESVVVRYVRDGEPRVAHAEVDEETETETWWLARFPVWNPSTRYRWLLSGGAAGYAWVNGGGVWQRDVPDADDFVATHDQGGPDWHLASVVYEIFPDRFASSQLGVDPPSWALPRPWDTPPTGRGPETQFEWYGGDLRGIEQRLDHVERLGASVLYLRSVFPATSTHRYDATSFERIDPLLGGDEAFGSLLRVAHARGLRVVGDLTANHTGDRHEWFAAAQADSTSPEREFYFFDEALPAGYDSWCGIPTLPKLDWRSAELRRRMEAVLKQWLEVGLDGWRIDVANMIGRRDALDLNLEVARLIRATVRGALLVAEHGHDFRAELVGGGWHGAINYAGFMRPVWAWLRGDQLPQELQGSFHGLPVDVPRLDGEEIELTMRAFRAGIPWCSALHSWSPLDSYDSARFRTVAGSRARQLVGVGLQMTIPGVPIVCAGDELGLEGAWAEDGRRPMPWDRPETWDNALYEVYRELIALRRSSTALASGGLRMVYVDSDTIAYLREAPGERLLCLASRGSQAPVRLPLALLAARDLDTLAGADPAFDAGDVLLPADGPCFHVWKLEES
jgi:alpha-glucosidase